MWRLPVIGVESSSLGFVASWNVLTKFRKTLENFVQLFALGLRKFERHFILNEILYCYVDSLSVCDADCEGKKATKAFFRDLIQV